MMGWLARLLGARRPPSPQPGRRVSAAAAAPPVRERDAATALAEAEERMKRLPPEKAQLIRSALLVHRVRQSALAELSDDEMAKLREVAQKALLGGGG